MPSSDLQIARQITAIERIAASLEKILQRLRALLLCDNEAPATGDHHGRLEVLLIKTWLAASRHPRVGEPRRPNARPGEQDRGDDEVDPELARCGHQRGGPARRATA